MLLFCRDKVLVYDNRYRIGAERVTLDPGESTTVSFELGEKELGFWNREGQFVVEPGDFRVAVWNGFSPGALARNSVTYKVGK